MKQSYFCNFDIKNEFLDPKNPHVQFSGIRLLQKWNYRTIFKTREQNLPLAAKNSNCNNLKTTRGIPKKKEVFFILCNTL